MCKLTIFTKMELRGGRKDLVCMLQAAQRETAQEAHTRLSSGVFIIDIVG